MQSMIRWINTPCTDPAGRVFTADGRVYRAVFPGQESMVRSVIENREVIALMDEGLIARTWASDRKVEGFEMVTEVARAPFNVPCERFTRATLRAATLRWLEISRRLRSAGLVLTDAHFGNYMLFGINEPRWIDLGSIRLERFTEEEKPFRSFRKFWSGMLAPLALIATQPRHVRLARLAIADRPYQGPLTTADESPLSVDSLVEEVLVRNFSDIQMLDAVQAMDRLRDFTAQLPATDGPDPSGERKPAAAAPNEVEKLCRSNPVASAICLGADAFGWLPGAWRNADVLVIDEVESRLDGVGRSRGRGDAGGQLALYYGHPVNRRFLDNPPAADAVLAVDPLARYAHESHVAAENLSHVLGALGRNLAIVITPPVRRTQTERMLRDVYPSVSTAGSSWFGGGGSVVVIGMR